MILDNAFISVNGVNLSSKCRSVNMNVGVENPDNTAMGANTRTSEGGLKIYDLGAEFYQDYAPASVDATLYPLLGAAPFTVIVRPDAAAVSTSNPNFTGSMILKTYNPVAGSVGDEAMATCEFAAAGDLARATA